VALLIAKDSNCRSTSWQDLLTIRRGRTQEEHQMSKQMHIMNEDRHLTTFRSGCGTINIDLTIKSNQLLRTRYNHRNIANRHSEQINCNQINLQHSRVATDKLIQIIAQGNTDMFMIQEPYIYQNRPKRITRSYRTYTHGNQKSRATIIITNNTIDTLLLTQFSDEGTLLLELHAGNRNSTLPAYTWNIKGKWTTV